MFPLKRREFLKLTAVSALGFAGQQEPNRGGGRAMGKNRPNILFIITHDTGRHLGCYGRGAPSPNLDKLAEEGVKFTQAFCTAPQCSPSRASVLTGLMPHRHGLIGLAHRGFSVAKRCLAFAQVAFASRLLNSLVRGSARDDLGPS
jgi:hypothetical protein